MEQQGIKRHVQRDIAELVDRILMHAMTRKEIAKSILEMVNYEKEYALMKFKKNRKIK